MLKFYKRRRTANPDHVAPGSKIVWVHFHAPRDGNQDYFFGSIKALFKTFNPPDIGASAWNLYTAIDDGVDTGICKIQRAYVVRAKNK